MKLTFSSAGSLDSTGRHEDKHGHGAGYIYLVTSCRRRRHLVRTVEGTGGEWLVARIATALDGYLPESVLPLGEILGLVAEDVRQQYADLPDRIEDQYAPGASIAIARSGSGRVEVVTLGDIALLSSTASGTDVFSSDDHARLHAPVVDRAVELARQQGLTPREVMPQLDDELEEIFLKRNTRDGYKIFTALGGGVDDRLELSIRAQDTHRVTFTSASMLDAIELGAFASPTDIVRGIDAGEAVLEGAHRAMTEDPDSVEHPRIHAISPVSFVSATVSTARI